MWSFKGTGTHTCNLVNEDRNQMIKPSPINHPPEEIQHHHPSEEIHHHHPPEEIHHHQPSEEIHYRHPPEKNYHNHLPEDIRHHHPPEEIHYFLSFTIPREDSSPLIIHQSSPLLTVTI